MKEPLNVLHGPLSCPSCGHEIYALMQAILNVGAVHTKEQLEQSKAKVIKAMEESGAPDDVKIGFIKMWSQETMAMSPEKAKEMIDWITEEFAIPVKPNVDDSKPKA